MYTFCQSFARSSQRGFIDSMSFIFFAAPAFDFLFAIDGGVWMEEAFVVDQTGQVVTAGESGYEFVLVLLDTVREIACDARV